MTEVQNLLLWVVELLGVIVAAVLLVGLLVAGLVAVLRGLASSGLVRSPVFLVALRILVGYREAVRSWTSALVPVSTQNFIAMVGTAIGVWALIVVLSVMGGFETDLTGKIVRHSPHATLIPGSAAGPSWAEDAGRIAATIPGVNLAEPFAEGEAMITSQTNMSPSLVLRGLTPGHELERSWLAPTVDPLTLRALHAPVLAMSDRDMGFARRPGSRAVEPMAPPADAGPMPTIPAGSSRKGRVFPGIVLGEELARSLSVSMGDEVTVVVPDGDVGPTGVKPRTRIFRVAGTFVSGMYEYDLKMAYLTVDELCRLFQLGGPNRVALRLDDLDRLDAVAAAVLSAAGPGGEVRTVAQTNRSLFSALKVEKVAMFLVLGLVILVAAFNVFGSLVLITMEKTRDIAVLRCMGATRGSIRRLFLTLGGVIGAVGTTAGLILGLGSCAYIAWSGIRLPSEYYLRHLPVEVRVAEIGMVVAAALGAALFATIHPATAAARLSPADGLRND